MLAWSFEEAGKILETYKIYENKPADVLMEKSESYPYLKVIFYYISQTNYNDIFIVNTGTYRYQTH